MQEKNRRAQKRFRERQKDKVKTMEDQLSEAYVEVAKLKEENNTLAGRNSILEKVLALRDEQLQQAARGQISGGGPSQMLLLPPPMTAATSLAAVAPPLRLLGTGEPAAGPAFTLWQRPLSIGLPQGSLPPASAASQSQPQHSALTDTLYSAISQSQPKPEPQLHPSSEPSASNASPALGGIPGGGRVAAAAPTAEGTKQDSPEVVVAQWKSLVRQMAALLVQGDTGDPANAAVLEQQLVSIAQSAGEMCLRTAVTNPEAMHRLQARSLEPGSAYMQEFPDDKTWQNVLDSLALSPSQVDQLQRLWAQHLERLNQNLRARADITSRLQQADASQPAPDGGPPSATAGKAQRELAMAELHVNMQGEREGSLAFVAAFFKEVLTPKQFAKAAVHSYPFFPNANMIANLAAIST